MFFLINDLGNEVKRKTFKTINNKKTLIFKK